MLRKRRLSGLWLGTLLGIGLLAASPARAEVEREGTWPEGGELVSLSVAGLSRAEAIRRLAKEAGWSVVVEGTSPGTVDVHVNRQPASKVLDLILADGHYRARRDGKLISIAPQAPEVTPPPIPTTAPIPSSSAEPPPIPPRPSSRAARPNRPHGKDRVVTGSSVRIEKDEVVGDLAVLGGSAEVFGTVSGDLAVFGGSVEIKNGAHIYGDVATMGGSVELEDGAVVDGDVSVLGGSLERHENAVVGGASVDLEKHINEAKETAKETAKEYRKFSAGHLAEAAGSSITRTALLFAFGAVLLALAGSRMEQLQREVASRPMRMAALGVVGLLLAVLAVVALCVTILGIPIALVGLIASVFGLYAGVCAALTAVGAALLHRRTSSPYVHLAAGCVLYLLLSSIPFVGGFVTAFVAVLGVGALVQTRAAGLVPRSGAGLGGGSYRPAPDTPGPVGS